MSERIHLAGRILTVAAAWYVLWFWNGAGDQFFCLNILATGILLFQGR